MAEQPSPWHGRLGHEYQGQPAPARPLRILHVLHGLRRAGAEQLVYEQALANPDTLHVGALCLDELGPLADELQALGSDVYCTGRTPGRDMTQPRKIAQIIAGFRPDILQAHQYTPFFYGSLGWRKAKLGRLIFTEHGRHFPDVVGFKRRLANRLFFARLPARITAVCEFTQRALVENERMPPDRIDVIYNGVDPSRFENPRPRNETRRELGLDPGTPVAIYVGRFCSVKGHPTALRAFAHVCKADDRAVLLLAGDGPDRADLEALAAELGIIDRVRFLGIRRDVPDLLAAADVKLLTSLCEAHSVAILEAMAVRLPVVATDVGGNAETVLHEQTGLLAPRNEAPALAEHLLRLFQNPDLRTRMGEAARIRVEEKFLRSDMHKRYLSLYHDLLEGKRA